MEAKHTKTPYKVFIDLNGVKIEAPQTMDAICVMQGDNQKENADFIANSCNAHYDLVDALQFAEQWIVEARVLCGLKADTTLNGIRAALKKAGAEKN